MNYACISRIAASVLTSRTKLCFTWWGWKQTDSIWSFGHTWPILVHLNKFRVRQTAKSRPTKALHKNFWLERIPPVIVLLAWAKTDGQGFNNNVLDLLSRSLFYFAYLSLDVVLAEKQK